MLEGDMSKVTSKRTNIFNDKKNTLRYTTPILEAIDKDLRVASTIMWSKPPARAWDKTSLKARASATKTCEGPMNKLSINWKQQHKLIKLCIPTKKNVIHIYIKSLGTIYFAKELYECHISICHLVMYKKINLISFLNFIAIKFVLLKET